MSDRLKLKSLGRSALKGKVGAHFPASINALPPLFITQINGGYTLGLSGNVGSFLGLSDTPDSYVGQTLKTIRVKADETGLEFVAAGASGTITANSTPTSAYAPNQIVYSDGAKVQASPDVFITGGGGLQLGGGSSVGRLRLVSNASVFTTDISPGTAVASRQYLWPPDFGAVGTVLTLSNISTGQLTWVAGSGGRERLSAARTYFVNNSTGSDANTGLASGTAFLTIQHAWDVIQNTLDLAGNNVTIQCAAQTFTAGLAIGLGFFDSFGSQVGAGTVTLDLGGGTISTAVNCISCAGPGKITVKNGTLTSSGGDCLSAQLEGVITISTGITFGACASGNHMTAQFAGIIRGSDAYTITGGALSHLYVDANGFIILLFLTATLTGTPAFSGAFATAQSQGNIHLGSVTYTGAATGKRYAIVGAGASVNFEDTANQSYFPGNAHGTVVAGSQYDTTFPVGGAGIALATNAIEGFWNIPSCAGLPTGVPSLITGCVPQVYDSTNNIFYIYNGGWKNVSVPAGATTQVQFNDGGAFGAEADLTWDKTANTLAINNSGSTASSTISFGSNGMGLAHTFIAGHSTAVLSIDPTNTAPGDHSFTISFASANATATRINDTGVFPVTNDGLPLGLAAQSWSDLFLASGGVLNWANGNVVLTHSSGILTLGTGDLRVTTAGTNTASVVTAGGAQTLTNKTLTSPTMTTPVLGVPASGTLTNCVGLPTVLIANEAVDTTCFPMFTTSAGAASPGTELPPKTNANLTYNASSGAFSIGITAALTAGTIELGNATDTTLARVSAGVISIEGSNILTAATGQPLDATLTALAGIDAVTGLLVETATNTFVGRSLAAPAAGFTITNPAGIAGNPTFVLADDLGAVEALATTGLAARTAASTWTTRSIAVPAAGISITNADGVAGNPTLALANDLAALEALSGTNTIYYRSAIDTWTAVTIGANLSFTAGTLAASSGTATVGDGDYGDIVVSGTGTVWTIDTNVVTYAKMQQISAVSKLLGRGDTGAPGNVQEITLGAGLSMTGTTLSSSGGSGAPASASYLTLGLDATLTAERVLTPGTGITFNDTGINGTLTITPNAATTTDVLTGTSTSTLVTPSALTGLWIEGAAVASATTTVLGDGGYFHITGTTTITDIDFATPKDGRSAIVQFDGILTLTHNATTLVLPGGANITTAAGDCAMVVQDAGDNIKVVAYSRANGQAIGSQPLDATLTALAGIDAVTGLLVETATNTFTGRTITGTSSRIAVTNGSGVAGNPTIDIDSAYVGQSTITTVGTITAGTWNGTDIAYANIAQGTARSVLGVAGNATADVASIQGTADQTLVVNSGGTALAFGALNLAAAAATTGDLPFSALAQGTARSVLGVSGNATADVASIQGTADQTLVVNSAGTALTFGALNLAAAAATTGDLPFSALAQGTARSVLGVAGNATADNASIQSGATGQMLNSTASAVAWTVSPTLGASGTLGTLSFGNATSGTVTLAPVAGALGAALVGIPATSGTLYISGGTDVALADGGTGASLSAPSVDRLLMWDQGTTSVAFGTLANIPTQASPASGDFLLIQKSGTDDLQKVDWATLPSGGSTITVANEATDTTCFPLFVTAATGVLGPKTNANLAYNSNTGTLNIIGPAGSSSVNAALVVTGGIGFSQSIFGLNASGSPVARFDGTGTSGLIGMLVTGTQTAQNTGDTSDGCIQMAWTINASSASNELIGRIFNFSSTNNLTGGGQVSNLRALDMTFTTNTGAVTNDLNGMYISTAGAGTINFFNGLRITGGVTAGAVHGVTDDCVASVWQHAGTTASSNTTSGALTIVGGVGIGGMINVGGGSNIGKTTATTNAVQYAERLQIDCSGTPAIGLGVGMDFNIEVTAGVFKAGAAVQASSYNITSGQETFTLDCRAMASNALGEPEGLSFLHRSYTADTAYTNGLSVQQWFLSNGAVAVEGATSYEFEGLLLQTPGTTSHTVGLSFAGSATLTSISYLAEQSPVVVGTTLANTSNVTQVNVATNVVVTPAITTAGTAIWIRGIVRINAAGTFIPSFTFSAAPGAGNNLKGTFFKMRKIGSNTNASQGRWT